MSYELPTGKGPVQDVALQGGYLIGFSVQALVALVRSVVRGRLSLQETVTQTLFIGRVSTGPSLLLMIPIGVFVAVSVGELAGRIGAGGYSGAVVAFIIVGQASALVCALMMAGVAGSAICTDLGSRKIREEIDALEVMGIDALERLVAPRLVAAVIVSLALCAMVTFGGVMACYLYHIYVQHLPAGTFLATFSQYGRLPDFVMALVKAAIFALTSTLIAAFAGLHAKGGPRGVADAVNEAVVIAFALVFIVNAALSALYTVVVPAVGAY
ncbi:ABC transporter permease [Prescottella agglutinans]|uniref:ABC transporter permease n=1 Tax=Prescottella agglutinans TaxID=1644129 RepID=A0A3S3CY43_9NOCA|nr:ABC transporter permease [Prescottella agglutinans]RVW08503.1 ABC transporter permease [Prescottella agglutinans]